MSFKIERGLFKHDLTDYHAVLGVPVDADAKTVRKRYLKIARRLHPDSCVDADAKHKQLAGELLSKLVNPAYEKLSNDRDRAEYIAVLSQVGKRLVQDSASVDLNTEAARKLASAPDVDHLYKTAIAQLSQVQYKSLERVISAIAQISELNAVYLMRTAGKKFNAPPPPAAPSKNQTSNPNNTSSNPSPSSTESSSSGLENSAVEQYVRRAQELITKNQLAPARVELQDALKLDPNSAQCHSLIGMVYLKQNQTKMAKVHFDRALKLDPEDKTASTGKQKVEQILGKKPGALKLTAKSAAGKKESNKSGGSGLFGGLFGGKKK
ncbi:MAG: DnaJ domain-containing protein [Cyanobacteria bacterium P01_A01_bin.84]